MPAIAPAGVATEHRGQLTIPWLSAFRIALARMESRPVVRVEMSAARLDSIVLPPGDVPDAVTSGRRRRYRFVGVAFCRSHTTRLTSPKAFSQNVFSGRRIGDLNSLQTFGMLADLEL
jgi:hypothetical protein